MKSKSTTMKTRRFVPSGPPKWIPHDYQKKAVKFLLEHAAAMLLLDPGLGKTSITLAAFDFLRAKKVARKMLVIAPLRVCYQVWPKETQAWDDFKHLKVAVLHGKHKDALLESDADVFVINPEGLEWLVFGKGRTFSASRWRKLGFDTLAIDELTRFKKSTGKRFKILKLVLDTFDRRWGLTGTPAPKGLLDLFGQAYVIDLGRSLGKYVTHYKRQYFRPLDPNGWKWALQEGAEELIYERMDPLALRMAADDYLELPERVDVKHYIELPPKVRKLYDQLEDDLFAKLGDNAIVAGNAAAASTKCRQICNGSLYVDDDIASLVRGGKRTVLQLHELKLDAVEETLEELQGQQMLLAYEFNHDLAAILKRFGNIPYIGAGVGPAEAQKVEDAWNAGDLQLLPAHPASAGHGLNLQKSNAAHLGWYGMFWDYELYDQFIKRILRQGNKAKRVFNHHYMARGTIDQVIMADKNRKRKGQDAFFDALKTMREERGE